MKLKDHCELVMQLLNSPYVSPYLEVEDGGVVAKDDIEHFVIVHTAHPEEWELRNRQNLVGKKPRKKAKLYDDDVSFEGELEDGLGEDEEKVAIGIDEELHLIRKLRKIACGSTSILADDGWFICPVYVGMDGLYPIVAHKLPNKRGYRLTILSTPLVEVPKDTFTKDNLKEWELNSILLINRLVPVGMRAMSVFVHKREDFATVTIRNAVNRLETTQRTRIKLGNILINEVRSYVGQEAYISNKESLAAKATKASSPTQYDMDDVKTIKLIEEAYLRINAVADRLAIKEVPMRRKADFAKAIAALKEEEKSKPREDGVLLSSDYIPSYVTYLNIKGYMEMKRIEEDAKTVVHELVHTSWLWPYIEGIKGCGEVTTAYILADIDFRSTIHPSSVLRYIGLDNVADRPRRDGTPPSDEDLSRIFEFLSHDCSSIDRRAKEGKLPPLSKETFYQYATDMITSWTEYQAIGYVVLYRQKYSISDRDVYEVPLSDTFSALVDKVWNSIDIVEYVNQDGEVVPTIKKHARGKQDTVLSTYLTGDGKVATKRSLGYNAKLKARILEVMFDSMTKAKNPYYYGEIYLNYKRRLEERYRSMGMDTSRLKMKIHRMARRVAVQVFIEELWMHAREMLGYPLNGGTYYEAKLKGTHGHGMAR